MPSRSCSTRWLLAGALALLTAAGATSAGVWAPRRAAAAVVGTAYVASGGGRVVPIAVDGDTPQDTISVKGWAEGAAITPDGKTAYVTAGRTVTPIDTATNIAGESITGFRDALGIAIDPAGKLAFVTEHSADTVVPIDLATNTPGPRIRVGSRPFDVAITPDGSVAYVSLAGEDRVVPVDLSRGNSHAPGAPIPIGAKPAGIAITPDGRTAYVANTGAGTVTPLDLTTHTPGAPIVVGNLPHYVAITPDGRTAYVSNYADGTVTPIATATNTPGDPIIVGGVPIGISVTPEGDKVYVANYDAVVPIDTVTNVAGAPIAVEGNPRFVAFTPVRSTTTTITATPDSAPAGTEMTLTATVRAVAPGVGIPSGTVQFLVDGVDTGAAVALTDGQATLTTTLPAGDRTVSAAYSGQPNFFRASAAPEVGVTVRAPSPALTPKTKGRSAAAVAGSPSAPTPAGLLPRTGWDPTAWMALGFSLVLAGTGLRRVSAA